MLETRLAKVLAAAPRFIANAALDWIYPRHCRCCGELLDGAASRLLCKQCFGALRGQRLTEPMCSACGLPLPEAPSGALCLACRHGPRRFDTARALVSYAGPAAELLKDFKFAGDFYLGPRLLEGMLKIDGLPPEIAEADAIVPVPLHPRRRRERGYDQALLLAQTLSKHIGRPVLKGVLVRTRYTSQQALLPAHRRWENVRRAFAVKRPDRVRGRRLLLVDDIMTSGCTADACAAALKSAGAARVNVFTVARTLP